MTRSPHVEALDRAPISSTMPMNSWPNVWPNRVSASCRGRGAGPSADGCELYSDDRVVRVLDPRMILLLHPYAARTAVDHRFQGDLPVRCRRCKPGETANVAASGFFTGRGTGAPFVQVHSTEGSPGARGRAPVSGEARAIGWFEAGYPTSPVLPQRVEGRLTLVRRQHPRGPLMTTFQPSTATDPSPCAASPCSSASASRSR
jgi:hypothetical protein